MVGSSRSAASIPRPGGDTPLGEVYDPVGNSWSVLTALDKPSSVSFVDGDAASMVLFDGRILFGGASGSSQTAIWSPASSSWVVSGTAFGTKPNTKQGSCDEESWTLLTDGSVLTVNVNIGGAQSPTSAERYIPAQDIWVTTAGALPVTLPLTTLQNTTVTPPTTVQIFEIGPSMLRNDGQGHRLRRDRTDRDLRPGHRLLDSGAELSRRSRRPPAMATRCCRRRAF